MPDPGEEIDFPPMAPPNGARATDLLGPAEGMQEYLDAGGSVAALWTGAGASGGCGVRYEDIVPEYDVNCMPSARTSFGI
jgi:hypothetical protein